MTKTKRLEAVTLPYKCLPEKVREALSSEFGGAEWNAEDDFIIFDIAQYRPPMYGNESHAAYEQRMGRMLIRPTVMPRFNIDVCSDDFNFLNNCFFEPIRDPESVEKVIATSTTSALQTKKGDIAMTEEQVESPVKKNLFGKLSGNMLKGMFQEVENVVFDLSANAMGIKTEDGIYTLSIIPSRENEGDFDFEIMQNPMDMFAFPIPAFGIRTPLEQLNVGDIIIGQGKRNQPAFFLGISKDKKAMNIMHVSGTKGLRQQVKNMIFGGGVLAVKNMFSGVMGNDPGQGNNMGQMLMMMSLMQSEEGADPKELGMMMAMAMSGGTGMFGNQQQAGMMGGMGNMMPMMMMLKMLGK